MSGGMSRAWWAATSRMTIGLTTSGTRLLKTVKTEDDYMSNLQSAEPRVVSII